MSTALAIDSFNSVRNIIEQAYPRTRILAHTEFAAPAPASEHASVESASSTELSRDYGSGSIIDRGNVFSVATAGLASMGATSRVPPFDAYNSRAFLVSQTPKTNQTDFMKMF